MALEKFAEAISRTPEIFSPGKLLLMGLIIVTALGKTQISLPWFVGTMIAFAVFEVLHNDFARILLNNWAAEISMRFIKKPRAGGLAN